ncbi:type II toxin-antitoxin system VapC family toxin [Rhizobium sp. S163]|uniref:type II toxin-antitoxin system VapC family toxin n=1 Tax=Rhizobium sp. S163 TaxID=3055039 RepID=UPI0025A9BEF7|nr:type II toxin-antitoxin system VapC family toxin [Rhizobium sp. S163]MDM9648819.1 type II toxin-antitoxin system VapC family toxin [Rhizobium sp. S163]
MIAVDTSALIAIVKDEQDAYICSKAMASVQKVIISAGTLAEAQIVALRANRLPELLDIINASIGEVIPVTDGRARFVSDIYSAWGKGFHPASLNFGDCFSYATAKEFDCPLLYIGNDFSKTDVKSAIASSTP